MNELAVGFSWFISVCVFVGRFVVDADAVAVGAEVGCIMSVDTVSATATILLDIVVEVRLISSMW